MDDYDNINENVSQFRNSLFGTVPSRDETSQFSSVKTVNEEFPTQVSMSFDEKTISRLFSLLYRIEEKVDVLDRKIESLQPNTSLSKTSSQHSTSARHEEDQPLSSKNLTRKISNSEAASSTAGHKSEFRTFTSILSKHFDGIPESRTLQEEKNKKEVAEIRMRDKMKRAEEQRKKRDELDDRRRKILNSLFGGEGQSNSDAIFNLPKKDEQTQQSLFD